MQTKHALVLSDLHFGDSRCSLHSMRTAHALVERVKEYRPIEEVFLLGDILDLQLATWSQSIEGRILKNAPAKRAVGFRYFLNFLLQQTGAGLVTYIPGNHDYKIFDYHSIDRHLILPLKSGKKLSGRVSYFRKFAPSFLQGLIDGNNAQFRVIYPHHTIRAGRSKILLTHGHYFDPSQSFYQEITKAFGTADSRPDIAKLRREFFKRTSSYQNMVSGLSIQPKLRSIFNSLYQPVSSFKHSLRHRKRKTLITPAMRRSIEAYLAFCCRGKVEGVIFGHTHQPGKATFQDGSLRYAWNCGTFLRESVKSPAGSFITVRLNGPAQLDDAVKVHLL